ncbi:MAG: sigma-70 family RNA polymerase sigma factor [Sphingobacteriales bacterium]|nr:MAG: sigma-70 family RNA polymerase sigma factor [Sphingobacteriales bacterium]
MSEKDNILNHQASQSSQVSGSQPLHDLIRDCIAQNRSAQKNLYDQFAPFIYGIIRRYLYNQEGADEVLNDAFYKIFTNLHAYSFSGSFEGWMRRIVINTITDHYRKYVKNEPAHKIDIEHTEVEINGDIVGKLGYKELLKLIHELPETQRAVFNLFVFEQYSHKEIAEQLGINENNSRWQLNDARRRLKEKIISM